MPNELVDDYEQYLSGKGTRYWKIAKQVRFGNPDDMATKLQGGLSVRAASNYRFLGLAKSSGESGKPVELTPVGQHFVERGSSERQNVLDSQILKMSLKNDAKGQAQAIDIFPAEFILRLLLITGPISFDEYKSLVIWAHPQDSVEMVAGLIARFRNAPQSIRDQIVSASIRNADVEDFDDNVDRLYDLFFSASYFVEVQRSEGDTRQPDIALAVTEPFGEGLLEAFDELKRSIGDSYETWDQEVSSELPLVDVAEQTAFSSALDVPDTNRVAVPIDQVEPRAVSIIMSASPPASSEISDFNDRRSQRKADYLARAARLADAGQRAEQIVVNFEKRRLTQAGKDDLAARVYHLAMDTDSQSYDVLSFNDDGSERHIEVKGVQTFKPTFEVYITAEETRRAMEDELFSLVLVFDYATTAPLVYEADELLTLMREHLNPAQISARNMIAAPLGWKLRFAALKVEEESAE